jgi:hypothetical protein
VNEISAFNVKAYPNPTNDVVVLEGLSKGDNIVIYDIAGKQVGQPFEAAEAMQAINISNLSQGVYSLAIYAAGGTAKGRIEVVRE